MKKRVKVIRIVLIVLLIAAVCLSAAVVSINEYVKHVGKSRLVTAEEASQLSDIDCILVLGCSVRNNTTPSHMLEDRLITGIELYQSGASKKMLMSGDHGREDYDEVSVMKQYAIDNSVPSEDIFMDHAGFSTYESIYRAKEIFEADRIIIVTQEYHLYRALYIAREFGLEAWGVSADIRTYAGQYMRDIREVLARNKDFLTSILKPPPTYLGSTIPVSGNGDVTND